MALGIDANFVIALRMMKLASGGWDAWREVELMALEKWYVATDIGDRWSEITPLSIISVYRQYVGANATRLSAS